MAAPGTRVGIEGRFTAVAFLGDNIDHTADGTAAVAHRAAALGDFDVVDGADTGKGRQIDTAPAVAGTLGVGQILAVDEDQDAVVAVQFHVRRDAGHHFIDRHACHALQGVLDRHIVVRFHLPRRDDRRIALLRRHFRWCFVKSCRRLRGVGLRGFFGFR